jgi:hypothetical protein
VLADGGDADGIYWLAGESGPFEAYCDQTTDGGGWTLALKTASEDSTFTVNNALWHSAGVLNDTDLDPA